MTSLPPRPGPSHTATTWALFLGLVVIVVVVLATAFATGWVLSERLRQDGTYTCEAREAPCVEVGR